MNAPARIGKQWNRANAAHGGTTIRPPHHSATLTDRFDFMVEHLSPNRALDSDLMALGAVMMEGQEPDDKDPVNNLRTPSAYTYFGQFIDHDLTFDPLSVLGGPNKLDDFMNFRTPRFDLDSLYGHGPHDQPYMYDGAKFRLGQDPDGNPDLLRIEQVSRLGDKLAVIGDKRNDENLIVSQIHLAFLLFHNKVVDDLAAEPGIDPDKLFDIAHQIVLWRYQHIVLFDYLRRITMPDVFAHLVEHGPQFFHTPKGVFMPLEFSVAAFRMGHSMIRFNYALNAIVQATELGGEGELKVFAPEPDMDLRGFRPRPKDRTIRWQRFLEFDGTDPQDPKAIPQFSMALDTGLAGKVVPPLPAKPLEDQSIGLAGMPADVPEDGKPPHNLAQRNLLRGRHLGRGLPSGQTLARHLGINEPHILHSLTVTKTAITTLPPASDPPSVFTRQKDAALTTTFAHDTPLWYYILKEAEVLGLKADAATPLGDASVALNPDGTNGGRTLGPLGSRIVCEVFFKLMLKDPDSILGQAQTVVPPAVATRIPTPGRFGAAADGRFALADLMKYVHSGPLGPLSPTPRANFGLR